MTTKPLPNSLQALFAKHPEKFDEGWTEKDYSEGEDRPWSHWIYLKPGWCNRAVDPWGGLHIIHESSIKEVVAQFKKVARCRCEDCLKHASEDHEVVMFWQDSHYKQKGPRQYIAKLKSGEECAVDHVLNVGDIYDVRRAR